MKAETQKAKQGRMIRITFMCEKNLAAWIRRRAREEGKSVSAFVRDVINEAFARQAAERATA